MEEILCKAVAVPAVDIEQAHRSLPLRRDAARDRLVVRVVENIVSRGACEKVKVRITSKLDGNRIPCDHIGHKSDLGRIEINVRLVCS